MADAGFTYLARQLETAWSLLVLHLTGLDDEEALWRPAPTGAHVWPRADGGWAADWPETEDYSAGPASIAWLTWHIGFWWSMVLNHSFGDATLTRGEVAWPGTAESVRLWLSQLHDQWSASTGSTAIDLEDTARSRWPMAGRPFGDVMGWVNVELMKNAAEIGYVRFLHAARRDGR